MESNASPKQAEAEAKLAAAEGEGHELTDAELAGADGGAINGLNAAISKSFLKRVTSTTTPSGPDVATPVADTSGTFSEGAAEVAHGRGWRRSGMGGKQKRVCVVATRPGHRISIFHCFELFVHFSSSPR